MSKEKIFLSIIAALLGLFVAGGAFYIYQMTQTLGNTPAGNTRTANLPTPTPLSSDFLIVDSPKDEEVVNNRTLTISGKTVAGAVIIVSTEGSDQVVKPSNNGDFTLTHTLEEGVNLVKITAIFTEGNEESVIKTVTYSSEEF